MYHSSRHNLFGPESNKNHRLGRSQNDVKAIFASHCEQCCQCDFLEKSENGRIALKNNQVTRSTFNWPDLVKKLWQRWLWAVRVHARVTTFSRCISSLVTTTHTPAAYKTLQCGQFLIQRNPLWRNDLKSVDLCNPKISTISVVCT